MIDRFEYIVYRLFGPDQGKDTVSIYDPLLQFKEDADDPSGIARSLTAAFLIILAGKRHKDSGRAERFLRRMAKSSRWSDVAECYLAGVKLVQKEIETACAQNQNFSTRLEALYEWLLNEKQADADQTGEKIWSVFFPEGTSITQDRQNQIKQLRRKRVVNITELNASPITDPGRQVLFTSNALLTVPDKSTTSEELNLTSNLKCSIFEAAREPQIYWYDHPVQIGVEPELNEVFYGLRGLDNTVEYERSRGNMTTDKITCLLSVSVTHQGLQDLAKRYLEEEISQSHGFKHINVYVCTEADTKLIVRDILLPAAEHYTGKNDTSELLSVFGVDGEYGRHYSFLKAISVFWNILIDPEIKATFKIDLDQVFPQKELVEQSGASAFEHFKTALWGAQGIDGDGQPLELGMIAGALVNEADIAKSLFTPDVAFPCAASSPEEKVFFSILPQALSTEAEMMMRYNADDFDGVHTCIQRIHVTGGTNGILVDSLRRHRPFTPSFIGRAEDQAYILSILPRPGVQLAYCHKDGLIMRHDKTGFAQEAIKAASSGKLVGDYIRTLFFSEYAKVLSKDISELKRTVDPFTGCFISVIPKTVVFLRFCLKAASFYASGQDAEGLEFVTMGMPRIRNALNYIHEKNGLLRQDFKKERLGWDTYYDVLEALENGLKKKDSFAIKLQSKARDIMQQCLITERVDG